MASTYSSSLRLELIGAGEQVGTWGSTTNRNLGTLLEGAIAGHNSISVTTANQAFTALDGADDQARKAAVTLTTTTTADFNVYAPPSSKLYVIRNASAYQATVYNSTVIGNTTAAGLGAVIPAGLTLQVFSDGTNFRTVSAGGVSGVTPVANGGTGATNSTDARSNLGAAPLAAPAFTGVPTAPTASSGTNTTQLATTAFVQTALRALYPVGSIYINAAVDTNPATLLGFGTWSAFGAGRVMIGQDTADTAFDTLQETGGSKDAIVVSHTHALSGSTESAAITGTWRQSKPNPSPTGVFSTTASGLSNAADGDQASGYQVSMDASHTHTLSGNTASTGSSGTNANLPPYIVVKMWRRTA
jgi:hypothetical protein